MPDTLKRIAAALPAAWQLELKRLHFRRKIQRGEFGSNEHEFALLSSLVARGDWVIDVGANVGNYALRLSELAGETGRVIALEPIPETMSLLAANMLLSPFRNLTLLNVAASDQALVAPMVLPTFSSGLPNYYRAQIVAGTRGQAYGVLTMPIDALGLTERVSFVKIDAEGHEAAVLRGMMGLIERSRPALLIETDDSAVAGFLSNYGYSASRIPGSANQMFLPSA